MTASLKVGDIVELQPTNQRNRQLRGQEKKYLWEVIKIEPTQCFKNEEGIYIKHVGSSHERWVQRNDVSINTYRENLDNE
jgi:hypothetical protein